MVFLHSFDGDDDTADAADAAAAAAATARAFRRIDLTFGGRERRTERAVGESVTTRRVQYGQPAVLNETRPFRPKPR